MLKFPNKKINKKMFRKNMVSKNFNILVIEIYKLYIICIYYYYNIIKF